MRILGVDPGLRRTGYGVVDIKAQTSIKLLEIGTIEPDEKDLFERRVLRVYSGLEKILDDQKPDVMVLEKLYAHYKHPATAAVLGHVRGVICLLCAQKKIKLIEHSVKRIRKSLVGNGNATKEQTRSLIVNLLKIKTEQLSLDASDALALALGHAHMIRLKNHMIARLHGVLIEKREHSILMNVGGVFYEVLVPNSIIHRVDGVVEPDGKVTLVTYHYYQLTPSSATPMLIGFLNEIERDFFLDFISVSGIGPRAAVKALNKPISEIAQAIHAGDVAFLKTLPGIGLQRAKEVVAKLQNKTGRFALIQDKAATLPVVSMSSGVEQEALEVLLQLQYKRNEAASMIQKAMDRSKGIASVEDLLNEIYKQRIKT